MSKIEWTGKTWNPIKARHGERWGYHCEHASEGCRNCYAERMNGRMLPAWGTSLEYTRPNREKVEIFLDEDVLIAPLRWSKPQYVFPCSMTDLFAEFVPDESIDQTFAVMALCPQHTFQVLTKRVDRLLKWVSGDQGETAYHLMSERVSLWDDRSADAAMDRWHWPLPNVWLGFSAEDQPTFDKRWESMRHLAAAGWMVWCSYEPALGPVDFSRALAEGLRWVVIGGESGPGARPFDLAWARQGIRQCREAGVPVFVKQMGAHVVGNPEEFVGITWSRGPSAAFSLDNRKGGDMAEWPEDVRVREYPC